MCKQDIGGVAVTAAPLPRDTIPRRPDGLPGPCQLMRSIPAAVSVCAIRGLAVLVILLWAHGLPAAAQQINSETPAAPTEEDATPAAPRIVPLDPETGDRMALALARQMMAERKFREAHNILAILERRRPQDRDVQILIAQADVALGNPKASIRRLEALRDLHPDWPRPRVELALAHAAAGNVRKAKAILIAELGKDPPPHVRRNIEGAIRGLEDQQSVVGRFSAGVVPDSNVTGGTYNDTVEFFGLPFTLNDDAKQQSGVRAEISAGATVRPRWDRGTRIELAIDAHHSEPLGDKGAPSSNAKLTLAMRMRGERSSMRTGIAVQPFYFDHELQRIERSLFTETGRHIDGPLSLVGNLTLTEGAFADDKTRDFRQWETSVGPSLALGIDTRLQVNGIFGVRGAESDLNSFLRRGLSMNLRTAPADGWRLSLAAALIRDVYREESLAYGTTQEDLITAANLKVVKNGFVFLGFSPSFGLGYNEVRSTIDLYDKRSFTLQLGVALPY